MDICSTVAIPLLLLKADIKKVKNESGKMLGAFHVSALGTVAGTFISAFLLSSLIPHIAEISWNDDRFIYWRRS